MCIIPVGEGAILVTTGRSDIELEGAEEARSAWGRPLSMRIRGLPSLGEDWPTLIAPPEARKAHDLVRGPADRDAILFRPVDNLLIASRLPWAGDLQHGPWAWGRDTR